MVVLNHKMYMNYDETKEYIKNIKDYIRTDMDVVMCPSNIFIPYFKGKYLFHLGAQNLSGTFATGEISGEQLKSLDVRYAIIGHSERKLNLSETHKMIQKNVASAIKNNIVPIVCVGESKEEHERKKTAEVIAKQLKDYFFDIDVGDDVVIAYEPVWSIGTGLVPKNDEIAEIVDFIKNAIFRKFGVNIRVLYGGSVNRSNIERLTRIPNLDGYLLGKVSVDVDTVLTIMNQM